MRWGLWLSVVLLLVLAGCSAGEGQAPAEQSSSTVAAGEESSLGAVVPEDVLALPRADSAGNTPDEVLLAYVRATNRQDWKTRWALIASPKDDYAAMAAAWAEDPIPMDDFRVLETRVVAPGRALVRVTYSTVGFSAIEGQTPEESRRLIVIREPGEWWVVEKGETDDAIWQVTFKGPLD